MFRKSSYALFALTVLLTFLCALPATATQQADLSVGSIKGKVKEQGGKSLEGVAILARRIEEKPAGEQSPNRATSFGTKLAQAKDKYETKTDSKGEFSLANLKPGNYVLTFEKQGFLTITTWQMKVGAGEVVKFGKTVELPREKQSETSLIRGAVFNEAGFSLPNARIRIERIDGGRKFKKETYSTEGGEFAFRVPSEKGTYRLTASADGFQVTNKEIEVDSSEIRQIALTLEKKPDNF